MASKDVNVIIRAIDKATGPLRKIGASVQNVSAKSKAHFRAAGIAASGFGNKMAKIGIGFGIMAGGVAAGIAALDKFTGMGDNAAKTADKLGVGVEALQEWRYAAQRSGMASEDLDKSLSYLVRSAGEAAAGTGTAKDVFKALGISVKDSNGKLKDGGQLMNEVADKIAKIENPTARATIAYKLFGKSGMGMVNMLKDGSKGLKQYAEEARATGAVISESTARQSEKFQDLFLDLKRLGKGVINSLIGPLLPAINKVAESVRDWLVANKEILAQKITDFLKRAGNVALGFAEGLKGIYNAVSAVIEVVKSFIPGLDDTSDSMEGWVTLGKVLAGVLGIYLLSSLVSAAVALWSFGASMIAAGVGLWSLLAGLAKATVAAWSFNSALFANPITWVVAGVLALAAAAYLIYKNWEPIAAFFGDLWKGITAAWDGLVAWFKGLWDRVLAAFDAGGFTAAGFELLLGLLDGLLSGTGQVMAWAFDLPRRILKAILPESWYNAGSQMLENLLGGLASGASTVLSWVSGLLGRILKALLPESWYNAGARMIGALREGLASAVSSLTDWMPDWIKERLGIKVEGGGSAQAPINAAQAPAINPAYHLPQNAAGQGGKMSGNILVQFEGAPPGTRVAELRADTDTDIDLQTGMTTSTNWMVP
jgi:hypothetical protein